jgi:branched-chain amino acid transport system substrate-binding protein
LIHVSQIDEHKFAHSSPEGYLIAEIATRALANAGPHPTRESLRRALDAMHAMDIGGFPLAYAQNSHLGSRFVEITMIRKTGEFAR